MKNKSTSPYGTIVAFSESPLDENLLYVGTDDGLVQITEDGGQTWRKVESFPGVPSRTYVNAIFASSHDENVVYAAFNHHKYGDFRPYLYKSTDKGRSWTSISSNLPEKGSVYSIVEDFESPDLLFAGTEFSAFFSLDGGQEWKQFAGLPTIAVRDMDIQKREHDLVLGTFGRGFFVLDDYSSLRTLSQQLASEAALFPVRDALSFEYRYPLGLPGKSFQGDSYYIGENLGSVAMFTYYMKDDIQSLADQRREREQEAKKAGNDNPYPNYEQLKEERTEDDPQLLFEVANSDGELVRKIFTSPKKGLNRIEWDLRYASTQPIDFSTPPFYNPFAGKDEGTLVEPGRYTVTLSKVVRGEVTLLAEPVSFEVISLDRAAIPTPDRASKVAFQRDVNELSRQVAGARETLGEVRTQLRYLEAAAKKTGLPHGEIYSEIQSIEDKMTEISYELNGDPIAGQLDQDMPPTVSSRVGFLVYEQFYSTAPPTETHKRVYRIANEEFEDLRQQIVDLVENDLAVLQAKLSAAGAPYTPYRLPEYKE
jgi:hypothetical protein